MNKFYDLMMQEESGQGMAEYALIISLVAVALITAVIAFRGKIADVFNNISFS